MSGIGQQMKCHPADASPAVVRELKESSLVRIFMVVSFTEAGKAQ